MTQTGTAESKVYALKFVEYARKNGVEINTENFEKWDIEENNHAEYEAFLKIYGKAKLFALGVQAMYRQRLFNALSFTIKPSKDLPQPIRKGVDRTSIVKHGVYIDSDTQRKYALEQSILTWKRESQRMKLWGLDIETLQSLLVEIWS